MLVNMQEKSNTVIKEVLADGKLEMHTVIGRNGVYYSVVDNTDGATVWDRTVAFGRNRRNHAGGAAFTEAVREQKTQAELLRRQKEGQTTTPPEAA